MLQCTASKLQNHCIWPDIACQKGIPGIAATWYVSFKQGVQSAAIFDSNRQIFVGMLTITDFIQLCIHYHKTTTVDQAIEELDVLSIASLRSFMVH